MEKYSILLEGSNYLLALDGDSDVPARQCSFLVWRCVESATPADAENAARGMVVNDDTINLAIRNPPCEPGSLQVKEVRLGFGDLTPPGSGYIFMAPDAGGECESGIITKLLHRATGLIRRWRQLGRTRR